MRIALIALSFSATLGACALTAEQRCLEAHPNDATARAACVDAAKHQQATRALRRNQPHRQDR